MKLFLWVANSQYDGIDPCRVVLRRMAGVTKLDSWEICFYLLLLAVHLFVTLAKLLRPGGARVVVAESLLLKHQLLISNRCHQRAPNLSASDRFGLALTTLFVSPRRIPKLVAFLQPATFVSGGVNSDMVGVVRW